MINPELTPLLYAERRTWLIRWFVVLTKTVEGAGTFLASGIEVIDPESGQRTLVGFKEHIFLSPGSLNSEENNIVVGEFEGTFFCTI